MDLVKEKFKEIFVPIRDELKELLKQHSDKVIDNVTFGQALTGMKGVVSLLTVTSKLDPEEGIRFRGYDIPTLRKKLPKLHEEGEPLPEGLFYLMLTGEMPTAKDVSIISKDWALRSRVPQHVFDVIDAMPLKARPMTIFSAAILSMATDSIFQKLHRAGLDKKEYWNSTYEDAMTLIARLPIIAAYIYRRLYHNGDFIEPDYTLDWAGNFAHMLGYDNDEVKRLMRLYMVIHADHEGGNVSAHATHLVGSALSNAYYSYAAGMTGLAGPLHGMANQEVIKWILEMKEALGDNAGCVNKDITKKYVEQTIAEGKVIPGFGHAVLRKTDPRYTAFVEFGEKYFPGDTLLQLVNCLYEIVPPVLQSLGKVKNPWPNVDAASGMALLHYGFKEYPFYTVLFGVSRALGVLSQFVWDRALQLPIERPKSQTFEWFKNVTK